MDTGIQLDNFVYKDDNDDGHRTQARAHARRSSLTSSSHTILSWFNFVSVSFFYYAFTLQSFQWQEHTSSQRGLHSAFCICLTYELICDHIGQMTRSKNWLVFFFSIEDNLCRAIDCPNLAKWMNKVAMRHALHWERLMICSDAFYFHEYDPRLIS